MIKKFIHIGFAKTGTSLLQNIIFPEWMRDNGVAYFYLFRDYELFQCPSNKMLISKEDYSGGMDYDHRALDAIKNTINIFGLDATYLISIRDLSDLAESVYKHRVITNRKPYRISVQQIQDTQKRILTYLEENNIRHHVFYLHDLKSLAEYMNINPPTDEQMERWFATKVNTAKPKILIQFCLFLNRLHLNWIHKWITYYFVLRYTRWQKNIKYQISRK